MSSCGEAMPLVPSFIRPHFHARKRYQRPPDSRWNPITGIYERNRGVVGIVPAPEKSQEITNSGDGVRSDRVDSVLSKSTWVDLDELKRKYQAAVITGAAIADSDDDSVTHPQKVSAGRTSKGRKRDAKPARGAGQTKLNRANVVPCSVVNDGWESCSNHSE